MAALRGGRSRGPTPVAIVLASGVFGAACGGEPTGGAPAIAGERLLPAPTSVDTLTADLRIGSETGREEEALGNVRDIEVGSDGTIYVLDGTVRTVRVFGPGGEFLRSIGRQGEGPGEFRTPRQMTLAPDGALWVYDDGARAILVLAPDGTEVARHASTGSWLPGGPLSFIWNGTFASDGRLLQSAQRADPLPSGVMGVLETRARLFLRSIDPATGAVDSVYLGEDSFRRYRYRSEMSGGGTSVTVGIVPYDARRLVALDGNGNLWTALSTAYVLERTGHAGDTLVVRLDLEATPFTPEERASWEENEAERGLGLELPERAHVLWRLFTDDENRLWAQRAAGFEATGHFDVFSPDGELLGSVFLPGRTSPYVTHVRGGHLYAVGFDEMGVSRVIRSPVPSFR